MIDNVGPQNSSGSGPAIALETANLWVRGGAFFVDGISIYVIYRLVSFSLRSSPSPLLGWLIPIVYNGVAVGAWGQTLGKRAAGITVVCLDGSPMNYPRAFGRALAATLSLLIFSIGYFMAAFNPERRTLHDYMAGSRVILSSRPIGAVRRTSFAGLGIAFVLTPLIFYLSLLWRGYSDETTKLALISQEGETKSGLGVLRTAITAYSRDHKRSYPETLREILTPTKSGAPSIMPQVNIAHHQSTIDVQTYGNEVCLPAKNKHGGAIDGAKLKDTGKWGYIGDKTSPCWGAVFVDCTHKDSSGAAWHSY